MGDGDAGGDDSGDEDSDAVVSGIHGCDDGGRIVELKWW